MSSINSHYTFNYSQPPEYKLSHDSVFLAYKIFELLAAVKLQHSKALDLCSGSGVVGLDFLFHRRQAGQDIPLNFDFLEIQNIYLGHFDENKKKLGIVDCQMNFLNRNYTELQSDEFRSAYDLIVCNPPYFFPNIGKLSPSEFKNRCRFFIDSDLENLFLGIFHSLKKNGVCFMNLKDLPQYKLNVIELARNICKNKLNIEITGKIRGTHFLKVTQITN